MAPTSVEGGGIATLEVQKRPAAQRSILDLPNLVESLGARERELFYYHFQLEVDIGEVVNPGTLNLDGLEKQHLVQVYDKWTHQKSTFNVDRDRRLPPVKQDDLERLNAEIEAKRGQEAFCLYREKATREPFLEPDGLMEGQYSVIVSSMFKSAPIHGIQIFREHNPRHLPNEEEFLERHEMAKRYYRAGYEWGLRHRGKRYTYATYIENRFPNAGSSIWEHGHGQLTLNAGMHDGKIEELVSVANFYHHRTEGGNYFNDLFDAYQSVGLGVEKRGVRVISLLTPFKEHETLILFPNFSLETREVFYQLYKAWIKDIGVLAFDLGIGFRPLEDEERYPRDFPEAVVRIIDRGDPTKRTSDMGSLETIMGTSVDASNPYADNAVFRQALAA